MRRKRWHLIGTLKSNRKLDGVRVDRRERALRHRRYLRVRVTATDEQRPHLVRALRGKLKDVFQPADVIRQHREEHAIAWLREACQMAIKLGEVEPMLMHFLRLSGAPST